MIPAYHPRVHGFSLHANTLVLAHRRDQLEQLLRYTADMARCPVYQQGRLRIITAITDRSVIMKILRHLKLTAAPPPIAPAQQTALAWAVSIP